MAKKDTISIFYESSGLSVALVLDSVEQETYSGGVDLAQHPRERGTPLVDTIRPQLRPLEVRGGISSAPLDEQQSVGMDRLELALEILEELRLSADTVTVVTPLVVRESMHLSNYRATHTAGMPGTLDVTLTFGEAPVVEAQRVKVRLPKNGPDRAKAGAQGGKQVAAPASEEAKRKSSLALQFARFSGVMD